MYAMPCAKCAIALLEADVALPVARRFIDAVTEKAVGAGGAKIGQAGAAWS